jgi:hypothetical protein
MATVTMECVSVGFRSSLPAQDSTRGKVLAKMRAGEPMAMAA